MYAMMNPSLSSLRNLLQRGLPLRRPRYPPPSATCASAPSNGTRYDLNNVQHNNYPNPNRRGDLVDRIGPVSNLPPHLIFPGAGIFFYWQAGVVTYLRQAGYDLSRCTMSGASAGSITATLAATDVCFATATDAALRIGRDAGVWERPMGLMGVWGSLIEQWLEELLPENAAEQASDRITILLTTIPTLGKQRVSQFVDRDDLIRCNIASVHLPLFLDGKVASNYRDSLHIDGSFLSTPGDHLASNPDEQQCKFDAPFLAFDFHHDPMLKARGKEFVKLASEDGIRSMMDRGMEYAYGLEREGCFSNLPKRN